MGGFSPVAFFHFTPGVNRKKSCLILTGFLVY